MSKLKEGAKNAFDSVKNRARGVKDNVAGKIDGFKGMTKDHFSNKDGVSFAQDFKEAKGLKKAAVVGSHTGKTMQKLITYIKAIGKFIKNNKLTIWILSILIAIILLFSEVVFFFTGISQSFNQSPHYYCDIDAPPEVKHSALYRQYCKTYADNDSIAKAAISLSTCDVSSGTPQIEYTQSGYSDVIKYLGKAGYTAETFVSMTPKLIEVCNYQLSWTEHDTEKWYGDYYASCDLAVALAIWWSGSDDNFPAYLKPAGEHDLSKTNGQTGYLLHDYSKGKWEQVKEGDTILPGDIALNRSDKGNIKHIYMYVATWENGEWVDNSLVQEKYPGSKANRYDGSWQDFYPRLMNDRNPWENSEFIFRFVGEVNEESKFLQLTP
jgi:hypothetical protein